MTLIDRLTSALAPSRTYAGNRYSRWFKRQGKHRDYIEKAFHGNYSSRHRKRGMEPIGFAGHYREAQR